MFIDYRSAMNTKRIRFGFTFKQPKGQFWMPAHFHRKKQPGSYILPKYHFVLSLLEKKY